MYCEISTNYTTALSLKSKADEDNKIKWEHNGNKWKRDLGKTQEVRRNTIKPVITFSPIQLLDNINPLLGENTPPLLCSHAVTEDWHEEGGSHVLCVWDATGMCAGWNARYNNGGVQGGDVSSQSATKGTLQMIYELENEYVGAARQRFDTQKTPQMCQKEYQIKQKYLHNLIIMGFYIETIDLREDREKKTPIFMFRMPWWSKGGKDRGHQVRESVQTRCEWMHPNKSRQRV